MRNPLVSIAVVTIKFYKLFLSPITTAMGARCRHSPSCSSYSIEAYQAHGAWAGSWLTVSRLLRCHPWGSSGIDPVPKCRHNAPFWAPWKLGDWGWHERSPNGCEHE